MITEYRVPTPGSDPEGITAGPDGNLWFAELGGDRIGRITTAGVITEYRVPTAPSAPWGMTMGPDRRVWFTETALFVGAQIGAFRPPRSS